MRFNAHSKGFSDPIDLIDSTAVCRRDYKYRGFFPFDVTQSTQLDLWIIICLDPHAHCFSFHFLFARKFLSKLNTMSQNNEMWRECIMNPRSLSRVRYEQSFEQNSKVALDFILKWCSFDEKMPAPGYDCTPRGTVTFTYQSDIL